MISYKHLLLLAGIIFMVVLISNSLLTHSVSPNELEYLEGAFINIEKKQFKGKLSVSFNIALSNQPEPLKVSADYTNCFDAGKFKQDVKVGDTIKVGVVDNDGPFRQGSVASIVKQNTNYFDISCRNVKDQKSKTTIPIVGSVAIVVFIGLLV